MNARVLGFVFAIYFSIFSCGCASGEAVERTDAQIKTPNSSFRVLNATQNEVEIIKKAVSQLPALVQDSITHIEVHEDNDDEHFTSGTVAHYCDSEKGICILAKFVIVPIVIHEVAHLYNALVTSQIADNEWNDIAGDVYGEDRYLGQTFPQSGILTSHASKNYLEDIAVWTENAYRFAAGEKDIFRNVDKKDKRYILKLAWLLKWGFINEGLYKKIGPLLK